VLFIKSHGDVVFAHGDRPRCDDGTEKAAALSQFLGDRFVG
jgi:hypothetical protein